MEHIFRSRCQTSGMKPATWTSKMDSIPIRVSGVTPVIAITIVILVLIFLVHVMTGEFKAERHTLRPEHGYESSKWYRFFTSPLVHANLLYLILSVLGLLIVGVRLERKLGTMLFMFTQALAWLGTVAMFTMLGSILYFITDYSKWMEVKNTGFGPIIFCYAVIDSYLGKRDTFRIILPWLLILLVPMMLRRVSALSAVSGCLFGLLLTRGGLGAILLPDRAGIVRAEGMWLGQMLSHTWSTFVPVWNETSTAPFDEAREGSMCSDLNPTNRTSETIRLVPMSSKGANATGQPALGV